MFIIMLISFWGGWALHHWVLSVTSSWLSWIILMPSNLLMWLLIMLYRMSLPLTATMLIMCQVLLLCPWTNCMLLAHWQNAKEPMQSWIVCHCHCCHHCLWLVESVHMVELKKLKTYSWKLKMVYWKLKMYCWKLKMVQVWTQNC